MIYIHIKLLNWSQVKFNTIAKGKLLPFKHGLTKSRANQNSFPKFKVCLNKVPYEGLVQFLSIGVFHLTHSCMFGFNQEQAYSSEDISGVMFFIYIFVLAEGCGNDSKAAARQG